MSKLLGILLILFFCLNQSDLAFAANEKEFLNYMQDWTEKKELASKYLREAEESFKAGDELSGCSIQKKASNYGIEATNSLISAMEAQGATDGLENLEAGLNKWRELGDFC